MGLQVFDLQLLVGRENIMGDKPRICIESVETFGNNLYIGTNDCFIHHYLMHGDDAIEKIHIFAERQNKKHLGMRKPVVQIKAALPLNQLLVNCDHTLLLLSMFDLSLQTAISGKIKNIQRFCLNERPPRQNPFSVEICVSFQKKKSLQIFQIREDQVVPMHEVSFNESPRNMDIDDRNICISTDTSYMMVNYETGSKQELFSFPSENGTFRLVTRVSASEFLVTAAESLAVFVSPDGTSNRPPIQWSMGVFAAGVVQPFIVALDDEFITVHSMLDQQQKQSLPFQGGTCIQHCEGGSIIVCTPKDVFILVQIPLQKQLNTLIANKEVDEALALVNASKRKLKRERYLNLLKRVQCMSGFVQFQEFEFDEALQLFNEGVMDPREIVCLFPGLLPESSNFKRVVPPFHDIASIDQMCEGDSVQILKCKEFTALYLELVCDELSALSGKGKNASKLVASMDDKEILVFTGEILYVTLIVFAQLGQNVELQHFFTNKTLQASLLEAISSENCQMLIVKLKENGCHHVAALLQLKIGDLQNAMATWKAIEMGEVSDSTYPGLDFVADELADNCQNLETLWQNAEWILQINQAAGVRIFTNHEKLPGIPAPHNHLESDDVVNFLNQFPSALMDYLNHLVIVKHSQKEKYHTHLVALYLELVLNQKSAKSKDETGLMSARKKLQLILKQSDLYRIHIIMGKIQDAELYEEQVILHSKLGEHEKALEILVHKVRNSFAAKDYCIEQGKGDHQFLQQMFQSLLTVYLQDISATRGNTGSMAAVVHLLNGHAEDFDPEKILHLLPSQWSVALLSNYLHNSLRLPLHGCRSKLVEHKLMKSQLLQMHKQRKNLHSAPVVMREGRNCPVCSRVIIDGPFARYPNGVIVHTHCAKNKYICPVTGKVFKVLPKPETKLKDNL
uniref:Transforming growth factor-beta receptor-associated protein 1-like n=1 Tax=Phallusia mammillata TaxID=59560 RepID=A0A6F9DTZ9_9ASCI|nr:transforming growth factor-beta receptor-associated protein 1-like [Phallusia mammillata]